MGEKMDMKCNIPLPREKHGGLAGEKDEKGSNACGPVLGVRGIQGGMFELRTKLSITTSLTVPNEMYSWWLSNIFYGL